MGSDLYKLNKFIKFDSLKIILIMFKFCVIIILFNVCNSQELPTNYEYYTSGGIKSGLVANGDKFHLNGKEITIFSGSFHPFRVHQDKWKDILLKFRAAGLNAVFNHLFLNKLIFVKF